MAKIHNLSSKLTLNTKDFSTKFDKARKKAKRFGGDMLKIGKQTAKFGAAAGVAAVTGLALLTRHELASIDAAAKFADSIGMGTEALAGLRYSANLTGVKTEALDKSLQYMVRGVGDAAQGTGQAKMAFDELGLSADKLAQMTPEQQFSTIADSINQLPTAADKASAAYRIFGRNGIALVNTLALGSKGLAENQAEAEKLGLAFSRVDAAKVEQANDAITRLEAVATGAAQTLTIQLAPIITATADNLTSMGTAGDGMGKKVVNAFEWVSSGVAEVADWLEAGKASFYTLQSGATYAIAGVLDGVNRLGQGIVEVINLIPGVTLAVDHSMDLLVANMYDAAGKAADAADKAGRAFSEGKNQKAVADAFANIRDKADKAAKATADNAAANAKAGAAAADAAKKLQEQAANQQKVADQLDKLDKQLNDFGKDPIEIKVEGLKALGATNDQLDAARQKLEKLQAMNDKADKAKAIKSTIDDLQQQVRLFGLSDDEKKLLELQANGASDKQLAQAQAAMDRLHSLNARTQAEQQGVGLIQSGSAEAQRLAYSAARGMAVGGDDIPKKSLDTQTRMAKALDAIQKNTAGVSTGDTWSL